VSASNRLLKTLVVGAMAVAFLIAQSCSIFMQAERPLHKNVNVLEPGNDRTEVLQELGLPEQNYPTNDGGQVDVYKIAITSETKASKAGWSALHIVADILTLFLWELVATPIESATQPAVRTYVVTYGRDNKIQRTASYGEGVSFELPTNIASTASPTPSDSPSATATPTPSASPVPSK
jgi:hypothetical protein